MSVANTVNDALKQRLADLEAEQARQYQTLSEEFGWLHLELQQKQRPQPTALKKHPSNPKSPPKSSSKPGQFVIHLTLDPKQVLEWAGTGWQRCGMGRIYPSLETAQQSLQQLQKHWPPQYLVILEQSA